MGEIQVVDSVNGFDNLVDNSAFLIAFGNVFANQNLIKRGVGAAAIGQSVNIINSKVMPADFNKISVGHIDKYGGDYTAIVKGY